MKVLCYGSLNIDFTYEVDHFVQKGETISSQALRTCGGGKGLNQSTALAKAGAEVYHAGCVGEDGRFLLEQMEASGIHTEYVTILREVRTGNAIIQNDRDGDNCIILYGGANHAITSAQADAVLDAFEAGDFLLLQNEINHLEYIIRKAHEKKLKIILNPSPMDEKILGLPLEMVDYFVLNEIEACQILSCRAETQGEEMAKLLRERFPAAAIVLTLGGDGSVYADGEQFFRQPVYRVKAVDTTAAGDTFTGYFIAALLKGLAAAQAMDIAARAAAIAVTRKGASPSVPEWTEAESFLFP